MGMLYKLLELFIWREQGLPEWLPHIVSPGSDHMVSSLSCNNKELNKCMSKNVKLFLSLEYLSSTLGESLKNDNKSCSLVF